MTKSGTSKNQEWVLLRQVVEPAFFLLLLARLGRLPPKYMLAKILGMDRRKVGRLLNQLIDLGFARSMAGRKGYMLNDSLAPAQQEIVLFFSSVQEQEIQWVEKLTQSFSETGYLGWR